MKRGSVIVIGGGLAGISAAVNALHKGLQVTLIEQRSILGGRAYSYHKPDAPWLDNGHHVTLGCYDHFRALLKTIGADANLAFQPHLTIPFRGTYRQAPVDTTFQTPGASAPLHVLRGLWALDQLTLTDKLAGLRIGPAILNRRRLNHRDCTVTDWLQRTKQPALLCEWLWKPICLAALNLHPDQASAKLFTEVIARAFFGTAKESCLGIFQTHLTDAYITPARHYIEKLGGRLLLGNAASRFVRRGDRLVGLELEDESRVQADYYISAVPAPRLVGFLDPDAFEIWPAAAALATLGGSPIVNAYLLYDSAPMDCELAALLGTTYQWAFDLTSTLHQSVAGHLISLTLSDARAQLESSQEALAALAIADIQTAFPKSRALTPRQTWIIKERRATMVHTPEHEKMRPVPTTPLRNLILAGDWTNTGLPCTLEGATVSGWNAVRALLGLRLQQQNEVRNGNSEVTI